jgi:hypothetical protein
LNKAIDTRRRAEGVGEWKSTGLNWNPVFHYAWSFKNTSRMRLIVGRAETLTRGAASDTLQG